MWALGDVPVYPHADAWRFGIGDVDKSALAPHVFLHGGSKLV